MGAVGEAATTEAAQHEPEAEPADASLQIGEGSIPMSAADVGLGAPSAPTEPSMAQAAEESVEAPTEEQPRTPTGPSTFILQKSPPPAGPQPNTPTGAPPISAPTTPITAEEGVAPLERGTPMGVSDEGGVLPSKPLTARAQLQPKLKKRSWRQGSRSCGLRSSG